MYIPKSIYTYAPFYWLVVGAWARFRRSGA